VIGNEGNAPKTYLGMHHWNASLECINRFSAIAKWCHVLNPLPPGLIGLNFPRILSDRLGFCVLVFAFSAAIGTIFHFIPTVSPFFAPSKGQAAHGTGFRGKVGFFALLGHAIVRSRQQFKKHLKKHQQTPIPVGAGFKPQAST
jgi:hypothetical protein